MEGKVFGDVSVGVLSGRLGREVPIIINTHSGTAKGLCNHVNFQDIISFAHFYRWTRF